MKLHGICALLLLVWLSPVLLNGQLPYAGVVITKQGQYEKDIYAKATPFTGMQTVGPITTFGLATGGRINIPNGQIVQIVNFGDAQVRNLSTPAEADYFRALSESFGKVMSQYPKSQPYLQEVQALIAADLQRYAAGDVRVNDVWVSAEEAEAMAKQRQERAMAEKTAAEARMAAERARVAVANQEAQRKIYNLNTSWNSQGAAFLAAVVKESLTDKEGIPPPLEGRQAIFFPVTDYFKAGVEVSDFAGCASVLYDGAASMSMACLGMSRGGNLKRIAAALPMEVKDGECQNLEQVKRFNDFITAIDPEIGRWLPVGLASARSQLQRFGSGATQEGVSVSGAFVQRTCSLTLTRPEVVRGGSDYYYLVIFIE